MHAPHEPCLACKLTGAAALACVGIGALTEAHRVGFFHAARRTQPKWGAFLTLVGIAGLGGSVARLTT